MKDNKQILNLEQMKAIARYEVSFAQIIQFPEDYDDLDEVVSLQGKYQYSLEDLFTAVGNLIKKDPTLQEFGEEWYYPVSQLEEEFGIDAACGYYLMTDYDKSVDPDRVRGLPISREDMFAYVWSGLEDEWIMGGEEQHISDIPAFRYFLNMMELFFKEQDRPVSERTFTDVQKKFFIEDFEYDSRVNNASELELKLCRQFTEELCLKDSKTALHLKGYSCYGGNRLYPCDWPASRDCMIRLYEKTDNAQYANTLGYIYYYGRCTGGEPEYEKAFEMFCVAAANGLYEGLYKLADMYRHGFACKKSPKTAKKLYSMVYEDSRKYFILGQDNSFADAALRMGNVYFKGIDENVDIRTAYSYYLQADLAHRRRMKESDFFGNTSVAISIRKALDEARNMLDKDFFQDYIETKQPWALYKLLEEKNRCSVLVKMGNNGEFSICFQRVPVRRGIYVEPVLITVPELDLCELTSEVILKALNVKTSFDLEKGEPEIMDFAEWNNAEKRIDCFLSNVLIGWISCDAYRLYRPEEEEPSGEFLRFVSVRFQPNGRSYDYLCDDETVNAGDTVIVPGYNGDTEVEVIKVFSQYESEVGLPIGRYKRAYKKEQS